MNFFQNVRPYTFYAERFKKGDGIVYEEDVMKDFDDTFQKQLGSNSDAKHMGENKQTARGMQLTEQDDLDSNVIAYNVDTTNQHELWK